MTALTFTATESVTFDRAALAAMFDREDATAAREYADAAYSTYLVATLFDGLLPATDDHTNPAYVLSQIAAHAADAEAAAHHIETGAKEYAEQFGHLVKSAKYAARMASALLDSLSVTLADLDAATGRAA